MRNSPCSWCQKITGPQKRYTVTIVTPNSRQRYYFDTQYCFIKGLSQLSLEYADKPFLEVDYGVS